MKRYLILFAAITLILAGSINAQNRFSLGLVGSRFENIGDDYKLTKVSTPLGYGLILGYAVNSEFSVALTGEYYNADMEKSIGSETDYRTHISAYLTPFSFTLIRPYISAGLVYTHQKFEYSALNMNDQKNMLTGRFGAGVDYKLLQNLFLNFDLGVYSDGLNVVGWSSSFGIRVSPKLF